MNRTLQLLGLLLIGLLSFQAENVRASQSDCEEIGPCLICSDSGDPDCTIYICWYGAGKICDDE